MFIDTHCHLDMIVNRLEEKGINANNDQLIKKVLDEAFNHKVTRFITVGVDTQTNKVALRLAGQHSCVYAACGIHPCDTTRDWHQQIGELKKLIKDNPASNKMVAIGEIGLDFFHQPYNSDQQKDAFKRQIELALELKLPIIIHSRNAIEETIKIVDDFKNESLNGVFHCFSENRFYAAEIIKRGFYLGIAGHITYPKNEELRATVMHTRTDHLLLETDAPFLPPQVIRGKINTPAQIATIGAFLADLFGVTNNEIAHITTGNAEKLFSLQQLSTNSTF